MNLFYSLSNQNINRYSSGGNQGNMTERRDKNFFDSIKTEKV